MSAAFKISFADRTSLEKHDYIQIYHGLSAIGERFFCYILCNRDGFTRMNQDYLDEVAADPASYGEIIYRDNIPEPDDKAVQFLEKYLADRK